MLVTSSSSLEAASLPLGDSSFMNQDICTLLLNAGKGEENNAIMGHPPLKGGLMAAPTTRMWPRLS